MTFCNFYCKPMDKNPSIRTFIGSLCCLFFVQPQLVLDEDIEASSASLRLADAFRRRGGGHEKLRNGWLSGVLAELFNFQGVHPGRLTWNIIMEAWKIIFLSKWVIFRFYVNLPESYPTLVVKSFDHFSILLSLEFGVQSYFPLWKYIHTNWLTWLKTLFHTLPPPPPKKKKNKTWT